MKTSRPHVRLSSFLLVIILSAASAAVARAQGAQSAPPPVSDDTRPATTTFFGDTGLWYVPSGEVLPHGKWSASVYRRGTNFMAGYTNVGDFAGTFAVGIKDRAEIFGSFLFDTRIDRDTHPLFFADPKLGGIVDRYPRVTRGWSGNNVGDFYIGGKVNVLSEVHEHPLALSVRALAKLPTGDDEVGVSTGKLDTEFDLVASREISRVVELSGFAGMEFRGNPDGFDLPTRAFRWGVGAGFPTRWQVRGFAELNGSVPSSDTATITSASIVGVDGTTPPLVSETEKLTRLTFGVTYQASNGFFIGGGLSRNMPTTKRNLALASEDSFTDYTDWQVRIGFHPGIRRKGPSASPSPAPLPAAEPVAPPVAAPPAVAAPPVTAAPSEHTLTVKAECDACTIEILKTSTVTATPKDSTGCAVTFKWTAPQGAFADDTKQTTKWTAPGDERAVPITVTATCPTDGKTATDTVNIQLTAPSAGAAVAPPTAPPVAPPPTPPVASPTTPAAPSAKTYQFDDVYFDFDRASTLRAEAEVILDEAIEAMKKNRTLTLTIEGYTCNVGTAEYNKTLAQKRAQFVHDYIVERGIAADRLVTVAHGEEFPKYDNDREETRRLNRRVALVVTLQQSKR